MNNLFKKEHEQYHLVKRNDIYIYILEVCWKCGMTRTLKVEELRNDN